MAQKLAVITGAILTCPLRPAPLGFISTNDATGCTSEGESTGCINDNVPEKNIITSECVICANGNIPCVPKFPKPWMEGVPCATDAGILLLTEESKIECSTGKGIITVKDAGQDSHFLGKENTEKNGIDVSIGKTLEKGGIPTGVNINATVLDGEHCDIDAGTNISFGGVGGYVHGTCDVGEDGKIGFKVECGIGPGYKPGPILNTGIGSGTGGINANFEFGMAFPTPIPGTTCSGAVTGEKPIVKPN